MRDDEYLLDLDTFAPLPGKRIRFKAREYTVRNFADIPSDDVFVILRAEQDLKGKGVAEQLVQLLRYIAILAPDMDREALGGLTANQLLRVLKEAMGAADIPPLGGDGASGSPISLPSSPASTAGPGASSGA